MERIDCHTQERAPILEALEEFKSRRIVPFDVPGHKRGRGNAELAGFLGDACLSVDVNSMKMLDNLCHPVSVIREAEALAAEAFGAAHAFFMVGGTTSSVQAMILTAAKRGDLLAEVAARRETLIFYEAPHHLKDTLKALASAFGGARPAAAARELTKRYEEFRRGKLADLLAHYSAEEPRGEFVLVVAGAADGEVQEAAPQETPQDLVARFMQEGRSKKEAMREAAKRLNLSRRDVYQTLLEE